MPNLFDTPEWTKYLENLDNRQRNIITENDSLEVVIKEGQFDVNRIIEYKGEILKKFEFRPLKWEHFVGQEEAKDRAKTIIKKIKKGLKSQFLVDGIKGHGKTTFV